MDEERDYKYDILRVFLTILVVVGHGTYYKIQTPFGGVDYSGLMLLEGVEDTKIHILTSYLTGLIYTFHMPVFFAFIIVYFIGTLKCKEVWKITLIFGLWVISVLQQSIFGNEWMPLGNPFKYALWFAVGTQYNYITNKIRILVSKKWNIVLLPIWVIVVLINFVFLKGICKILVGGLVVPFIAIILLYYWADKISNLNYNKQRLMSASAFSFGIYLWAEPLNYLILHWVYVNLGVAAFGNEVVASVIFCES